MVIFPKELSQFTSTMFVKCFSLQNDRDSRHSVWTRHVYHSL